MSAPPGEAGKPAATVAAPAEPSQPSDQAGPSQTGGEDAKQDTAKAKEATQEEGGSQANGEAKLSGAELKKRAKAEKAARRERERAAKEEALGHSLAPPPAQQGAKGKQGAPGEGTKGKPAHGEAAPRGGGAQAGAPGQQAHRKGPAQGNALPVRGARQQAAAPPPAQPRKSNKEVGLFGHLYSQPKRNTIEGVSKEVHPAVLALGLQMSTFVVCGSNARCVAMLLAFKRAIQDYQTPHKTSLARHVTSHYLSPQIDYLKSHRPISVSMGNAIRWLKDFIIHIDPDTPEAAAKEDIGAAIDTFIRERITVADTAIAATATQKIRDGSTVVTYAKSSIVEKTLLHAHAQGIRFRVVVVDSRPLDEGKNLLRSLARAGIQTTYVVSAAAPHALKGADLVLLGAHAMMANGRLYSRVGTASVAMLARNRDIPVIVLCESIKFTDRVALDSIVLNELAPAEQLLLPHHKAAYAPDHHDGAKGRELVDLTDRLDVQGLQVLNILYDVTPAECINMVITEYGSLPPSSVPVVHRISTERDVRV